MKKFLLLLALCVSPALAADVQNPTPPAGSNTQVQFNDNGTFGGNGALTFDKSTGVVNFAPSAPTTLGGQILNFNALSTASLPAIPHPYSLRVVGKDSNFTGIYVQSWGQRSILNGYNARGTAASPSANLAGDELYRESGRGYGATDYTGSVAGLSFFANQNFTDAAQGGWAGIRVTPNGSAAGGSASDPPLTVGFSNSGGLLVGKDYFSYSGSNTSSYATEPGNGVGLFEAGIALKGGTNADYLTVKAPAGTGTPTITLPYGTTDFSASGGASQVVKQTTAGGPLTVGALTNSDVGLGNVTNDTQAKAANYPNGAAGVLVVTKQIDFSVANTDFSIAIPLPTGFTRYRLFTESLSGASASLSGATFGLFSAAAGGGTALISSGTSATLAVTAENTAANMQNLTAAITITTESLTFTPLFFRVQNSAAATAWLTIVYIPIS